MIDNQPLDLDVVLSREKLVELTGGLVDRTLDRLPRGARGQGPHPRGRGRGDPGGWPEPLAARAPEGGRGLRSAPRARASTRTRRWPSAPRSSRARWARWTASCSSTCCPCPSASRCPGGRFKPVLERNITLPASKSYTLSTSRDRQSELEVVVFQGDSARAEENEYLGTLRLTGLPPLPRGAGPGERGLRGDQRVAPHGEGAGERDRTAGGLGLHHPRHPRGDPAAGLAARGGRWRSGRGRGFRCVAGIRAARGHGRGKRGSRRRRGLWPWRQRHRPRAARVADGSPPGYRGSEDQGHTRSRPPWPSREARLVGHLEAHRDLDLSLGQGPE